jgi:hypothetical protein
MTRLYWPGEAIPETPVLKPLEPCPPELLPARGEYSCDCAYGDCSLRDGHDGSQHATVSLSGLVLEVWEHGCAMSDCGDWL